MGTDDAEIKEPIPYPYSFPVHNSMCTEMAKLVDRIAEVFPDIEAERPRCSSGIQSLCMLNNAIEGAKQHLQQCSESSKLYLAMTGDVIVKRCRRTRDLLEKSLGQIQNMVPVMLAVKISRIIDDLQTAVFKLDPSEEEAGKAVLELFQQGPSISDSVVYSEVKVLQFAASRLHITSSRAVLLEKRCIKKLLVKCSGKDPTKRKILNCLFYLLKKYGNLILEEQTEHPKAQHEEMFELMGSGNGSVCSRSIDTESLVGSEKYEGQANILSRATPPPEFKCPISTKVMYDPVTIASGQTFERMWIQKWFDEGNDTCPRTKVKLSHRSLTPNTSIKDLISKWCTRYGITIPDPTMPAFLSSDISSSSIASLGSFMNDLHLPLDMSNVSLGSMDSSYASDRSSSVPVLITDDSKSCQSYANISETDCEILSKMSELPWESQCKLVEDFKVRMQYNQQVRHSLSSQELSKPFMCFLKDAHGKHDETALRDGLQLFLASFSENRCGTPSLHEETVSLLSSLLDSERNEEALCICEVLSANPQYRSKIVGYGALVAVVKILDSESKEFQERAIKVLLNLSYNKEICSQIVSLECIPKLVPFINDSHIARYCIALLKNLCDTEEARVSVAETKGCIASIVELLESGSLEDQEHAVAVLLSLCSQNIHYCQLVMDEGVIPSLVDISINGNDKGKATALELLRQLKDAKSGEEQESSVSDLPVGGDVSNHSTENKSARKTSRFFKFLKKK
ncbi:hypothetical protein Tsubulata_048289 [Turnera subulata]|uniref:RING-type E3 ubiquitin transferase n=1 Tax=Turnera subulata TaxID=218843 RepID=A0A9Q0JPS9_9ROSI|nr:hypothetical protein Tsubulata_048289 [Turnera subulata]